jgi:hypothetical protein
VLLLRVPLVAPCHCGFERRSDQKDHPPVRSCSHTPVAAARAPRRTGGTMNGSAEEAEKVEEELSEEEEEEDGQARLAQHCTRCTACAVCVRVARRAARAAAVQCTSGALRAPWAQPPWRSGGCAAPPAQRLCAR